MTMQYYTSKEQYLVPREIFPTAPRTGAESLTVAETVSAEDFLGFGVALTGSSCYLLSKMEPAQRKALLQDIFGKDGLNLSVARLSVGASDYSPELYSYDDVPFDTNLEHFSIAKDRAYIIPMIREVLAIRPDLYIFASDRKSVV